MFRALTSTLFSRGLLSLRALSTTTSLIQGYLAHKKPPHPRTLQQAYACGLKVVQGLAAVSYERGTPGVEEDNLKQASRRSLCVS